MTHSQEERMIHAKRLGIAAAAALVVVLLAAAGCKHQAARTDQQVATDVQYKIQGESALRSQNIQVGVANGIATLNGTVTDEASRALAANDAATIDGVKTVVNNLTVQPAQQAAVAAPSPATAPASVPQRDTPQKARRDRDRDRKNDQA